MRMKYFFVILILSICQFVYGQHIHGKVRNSQGEALELVNVLLYKVTDSTFVTGTITDPKGEFIFHRKNPQIFYIKFSSLGHQDTIYKVIFTPSKWIVCDKSDTRNLQHKTYV